MLWVLKEPLKHLLISFSSKIQSLKNLQHGATGVAFHTESDEKIEAQGTQGNSTQTIQDSTSITPSNSIELEDPPGRLKVAIESEESRIWHQQELESYTDKERKLLRVAALASLSHGCEIVWKTIFQSQIKALRLFGSTRTEVPIEEFRIAYLEAKMKAPESYETYDFEAWLKWLIDQGLVTRSNYFVAKTAPVDFFLEYVETRNYNTDLLHP